jgi:Zn-dependent protease with chaperone function
VFELLGICLALSALLTLNALAALLASALWSAIRGRAKEWPAGAQARLLFALRVFPPIIAIACVGALLVPAYIRHEPRSAVEPVSLKLGILAAVSAAGLLLALWRGVAAWLATHRLIRNWMSLADPVSVDRIPAYRLRHQFPVIAIVGAIRPKLFIADHLFQTLTREELAAAIAHECGHLAARDNLRRAAMRFCRDALAIFPTGGGLDRAWAEASESAADEYAASGGRAAALDLASTLVKVARLVPKGVKPAMPAMASFIIADADVVARRVLRLTQLATGDKLSSPKPAFKAWPWACFAAINASATLLALDPATLLAVHGLIEIAVSKLQ